MYDLLCLSKTNDVKTWINLILRANALLCRCPRITYDTTSNDYHSHITKNTLLLLAIHLHFISIDPILLMQTDRAIYELDTVKTSQIE
jgi:hypothetical protein